MRSLLKLAAGIALAVGISTSANAATIDFPAISNPYVDIGAAFCLSCTKSYEFTLPSPYKVTIKAVAGFYLKSSSWSLTGLTPGTIASGSTGVVNLGLLTDFGPQELAAGTYTYELNLTKAVAGYVVTISGSPVSSVPLPGAALLFASGLAALGFAGRRFPRRRRAAAEPETPAA